MKKEDLIKLIIIIVLIVILGVLVNFTIKELNSDKNIPKQDRMGMQEENVVKETTANDVESGTEVTDKQIDLSKYTNNITITEAGEYTLTGNFENAVLVNAKGDVSLILDGVNIENKETATIANISTNNLTIKLAKDSINKLSDGGSSEYYACIYSMGNLIIEGEGTLKVKMMA